MSPRRQALRSPEHTHRIAAAASIRAQHHLETQAAQNVAAESRLRAAITSEPQIDTASNAKREAFQKSAIERDEQRSKFAIAEMRVRAAYANAEQVRGVVSGQNLQSQSITVERALAALEIRSAVEKIASVE